MGDHRRRRPHESPADDEVGEDDGEVGTVVVLPDDESIELLSLLDDELSDDELSELEVGMLTTGDLGTTT